MMKKLLKKYSEGSFFLNIPLITNVLIALVSLPIILSSLPVADYGKWQFVLAFQVWLSAFSASNITQASKRGITKGLNGTFIYAFVARLKLLIPAGILLLGIATYLKIISQNIFSFLFAIVGVYLILGYLFQNSLYEFFIAKKRFKEWCFWQITIALVSVVGSAVVAFLTKDIVYFALFQLGSASAISLIPWFWIVIKEKLIRSYKRKEIDKECVPYGIKLIPYALVTLTASKASHFIIGPFFGFANLAIFSVANKLKDKFASIIKSTRLLLYADFARIDKKRLGKIINIYLLKIGIVTILISLGFIGVGWFYIKFFLPAEFNSAIIYFIVLVLGLPTGALSIILHTLLESHLCYKELTVVGTVSNLLKVILILIFGYLWQVIGVCIAITLSSIVSFGFYYLLTIKREFIIMLINRFPLLKKLSNF